MVKSAKIIKVGQLQGSFDMLGRVYSPYGICPTILSNSHGKTDGGYNALKILVTIEDNTNENCREEHKSDTE